MLPENANFFCWQTGGKSRSDRAIRFSLLQVADKLMVSQQVDQ
jgi:hypothetical protein